MDQASVLAALHRGSLVAIITLPNNFSNALANGQPITLHVDVDNVNADMTDDIQRALPAAIVDFGRQHNLPGIRLHETEIDLIGYDTSFIAYLVVSGLMLDAFIIASILSAMVVAREFEARTIKALAVAPVHSLLPILGRMLATDLVACVAMLIPVAIAIFGYHSMPIHPLAVAGILLLSIAIFGCVGVAIGALLRRTLPVVSLILGLGFAFYLCSGSLEPQRFDGPLIWGIAHISPVYYAVGILEQAYHGLQVTPEPQWLNLVILLAWAGVMVLCAALLLRIALIDRTGTARFGRMKLHIAEIRQWRRPSRLVVRSALGLLILLILLGAGRELWLNTQQQRAESLKQHQLALNASEDRHETALLNDYVQRISTIVAQNPHLYTQKSDPARGTVTTLTQSMWPQLKPAYKVLLLRYLYKEKFIDDDYQVVSLQGIDLHGCNMAGINLSDTDLSGANFSNADMHNSKLVSSTLIGVNFSNTSLVNSDLKVTDMHNITILNANLAGADLAGVIGIDMQQLLHASSLAGTRLPDGSVQPGNQPDKD
jgi:ABC-2 type transport system permease protein